MEKKEVEQKEVEQVKRRPKFTKGQLLESRTSEMNKDVLASVLEDEKTYTLEEAKELVDSFNKRKVK